MMMMMVMMTRRSLFYSSWQRLKDGRDQHCRKFLAGGYCGYARQWVCHGLFARFGIVAGPDDFAVSRLRYLNHNWQFVRNNEVKFGLRDSYCHASKPKKPEERPQKVYGFANNYALQVNLS